MIKVIETVYNGYRFRSRLEARWAVFFDTLGIEYQYEVEGFDLGEAGWYLPDFWLPQVHWWIEIKGQTADHREVKVAKALEKASGCRVVLLIGTPWHKEFTATVFPAIGEGPENIAGDALICTLCLEMAFQQLDIDFITDDTPPATSFSLNQQFAGNMCKIDKSYTAARQARFERGAR